MSEAMWKRDEGAGPQPTPSWALYAEAANRFRSSAEAFMEHVHLLTEARSAYQQAVAASTELRSRLDAGDQALRSIMTQLEQVVTDHLSEPVLDRKKFFFPYVSPKKPPGFHAGRSLFCATRYPTRKLNRAYSAPASKSSFWFMSSLGE